MSLVVGAGLALIATMPASEARVGLLNRPAELGTVDTIAGPGFCDGPARPEPASSAVAGAAADAEGNVWFETSDPEDHTLTRVGGGASVFVVKTGAGAHELPAEPGARLAADHRGAALVATSTAILRIAEGVSEIAGTTVAEAPPSPHAVGDGGPSPAARFRDILAVATDTSGNVYVADRLDDAASTITIRFVNRADDPVTFYGGTPHERTVAPGHIDTIAGGPAGSGRPAAPLVARAPLLAVAGDRLYLATEIPRSHRSGSIRALNLSGRTLDANGRTIAPGATAVVASVSTTRGGPRPGAARSAVVVAGIAADENGNVFVAEQANHRVTRVDPGGALTVFAGTGTRGFNGNGRPAVRARLAHPGDVDIGPGGRVYISDVGNGQLRFVDSAGTIHAAPGNGATTAWTCLGDHGSGPPAPKAGPPRTGVPSSVATDSVGNVYITTLALGRTHVLSPTGAMRLLAPDGAGGCADGAECPADDGIPAATVSPAQLRAVAGGPSGGLYVVQRARVLFLNRAQRAIRVHGVVVPPGGIRPVVGMADTTEGSTVAPSPVSVAPPSPPDGARALAKVVTARYEAVVADGRGSLLVADMPQGRLDHGSVREVTGDGVVSTLIERLALREDGSADPRRCCARPTGLAVDHVGNLYIADASSRRVWFLNRGSADVVVHGVRVRPGAVEAVAGSEAGGGQDEGAPALETQLSEPAAVAVDRHGNLYVADAGGNVLQRVDTRGALTTVAGTGQAGFNGDGRKGAVTALNQPLGVVVDACGNLLIADSSNDRVRRLTVVASCPPLRPRPPSGGNGRPLGALAAALAVVAVTGALVVRRRRRVTTS